jgi:integrase
MPRLVEHDVVRTGEIQHHGEAELHFLDCAGEGRTFPLQFSLRRFEVIAHQCDRMVPRLRVGLAFVHPTRRVHSQLARPCLEDEPAWRRTGILDGPPAEDVAEERSSKYRIIRVDEEMYRGEHDARSYRPATRGPELREHKARSHYSQEQDFVFASKRGTALGHRNICRTFTEITEKAGLGGEPRFTFHSLRAVYAALMIERGITSTVLASQMGHADSGVTERKYVHLFNRTRTDEAVRAAMQEAMGLGGKVVASTDGKEWEAAGG